MKFFTRYDPPPSPAIEFHEKSITEQYHRSEVNINDIIARYNRQGILGTPTQVREMFFGDFSGVPSRLEYEMTVSDAKEKFLSLPSSTRAAFNNDPYQLLKELDSGNLQKFIDLGMIKASDPAVGTVDNPGDVSHVVKDGSAAGAASGAAAGEAAAKQ